MAQSATQTSLYESDFLLWLEDTVACLKARDIKNLDWENLIEEIEALGRSERHELESRLDVLFEHLLKRCYVNSLYDNRGWENTIAEQRRRLRRSIDDSPSLKGYFLKVFDDCYQYALEKVRKDYPNVEFPDFWQFNRDVDAILTEIFWKNSH